MTMGPEPRIRIFEMSVRLGMNQSLVVVWSLVVGLVGTVCNGPDPSTVLSSRAKRGICIFNGAIGVPQSSARSCQVGFIDLIKTTFFARDHPFICFSLAIASRTHLNDSSYTRRLM